MRVTHFIRRLWTSDGGTNRAVLDLCDYQARAGAEVLLATFDDRDAPPSWRQGSDGIPRIVRLERSGRLRRALGRLRDGHADALLARTDVLHLHDLWEPTQSALTAAARRRGVPYVLTPHGMLADWAIAQKRLKKDLYLRLFGRALIDGAAFIHLTAQGELDQSVKWHPRTPGAVIPLIFDLEPYRDLPSPEPARRALPMPARDVPTLLYLSRLHVKKRPDLLVKVARPLRDMGLRINVVLAGPGDPAYASEVLGIAKQLGVDDITTCLGMVTDLKASVYAACDLFVLPSHAENFGFVYFESLACGTPLVTTKGADTWRELEASGGGTIVDAIPRGDEGPWIEMFARVIADQLRDRASLKLRGQAARRWVLDHLDPANVVAQYLSLYSGLVGGGNAAPGPEA